MNRRGFLLGALSTPVVITTPNLLMPVKPLVTVELVQTFQMLDHYNSLNWIELKAIPEFGNTHQTHRETT